MDVRAWVRGRLTSLWFWIGVFIGMAVIGWHGLEWWR